MCRNVFVLLLGCAALCAGCNWLGVSSGSDRDDPIYVQPGEPFWLYVGQTAHGPSDVNGPDGRPLEQTLTFRDVVSDSRCPSDVECVVAGHALLLVQRTHPAMRFGGPDTLLVGDVRPDSVRADGPWRGADPWRALDLRPYPRSDRPAPPARAYRAQFVLE